MTITKYTGSVHQLQKVKPRKRKGEKNNTHPQQEPKKSINLIKDKRSLSINNLTAGTPCKEVYTVVVRFMVGMPCKEVQVIFVKFMVLYHASPNLVITWDHYEVD